MTDALKILVGISIVLAFELVIVIPMLTTMAWFLYVKKIKENKDE